MIESSRTWGMDGLRIFARLPRGKPGVRERGPSSQCLYLPYEICAEGIPQAGRIPGGAVSPRIHSRSLASLSAAIWWRCFSAATRDWQGSRVGAGNALHGCSSCPYPIRIRRLSGICPGCGPVGVHDSRSLASLSAATPACIEFLGSTLFPGSTTLRFPGGGRPSALGTSIAVTPKFVGIPVFDEIRSSFEFSTSDPVRSGEVRRVCLEETDLEGGDLRWRRWSEKGEAT